MIPAGITFAAEPVDDKDVFSIVLENDSLTRTSDSNYTNGIRFSWLSSNNMPRSVKEFADMLPVNQEGRKRVSIALGQSIYTPTDLSRHDLIINDRPYAGWLYTSVGIVSDSGKILDNAMVTVGVVGRYSLAEQSQKVVHRILGFNEPQGWDNQLKTEPGLNFTFERTWRSIYQISPFGVGFDVTPHAGTTVGNVDTNAAIGTTFRLGYDLPADYGPPRIRPSLPGSDFFIPTKEFGGYLFMGFEGRAVARDIFLDGNTFTSSHHVEKEPLVGSIQAGLATTYKNTRISYTHVFMTREFEEQRKPQQFGALTLSWRF